MSKSGGSLGKGRRTRQETPPVPEVGDLTDIEQQAQRVLRDLVEAAGGRFAGGAIGVGHLGVLSVLFDSWGRRHAREADRGLYFSGRPGLWHALDELYPLQDPNRWDNLRAAVIKRLEDGSWERRSPPRGTTFYLSD